MSRMTEKIKQRDFNQLIAPTPDSVAIRERFLPQAGAARDGR
jgi:hypothetical protein